MKCNGYAFHYNYTGSYVASHLHLRVCLLLYDVCLMKCNGHKFHCNYSYVASHF